MKSEQKTPITQIAHQSKAAECVRQADEGMAALIDELSTTTEVLSDPYKTSVHLLRCMNLAHEVRNQLYQTGIPKYRQMPLYSANRQMEER